MSIKNAGLIAFEGYRLDRERWTLHWREEPIALSRKSFDLLLHLIDHREHLQTKDELLEALWPKQVVQESNLTQHIFLLRKALSRHESGIKIIDTVVGRGYRFAATLAATNEVPAATNEVPAAARAVEIAALKPPPSDLMPVVPKRLLTRARAVPMALFLVALLGGSGVVGWRYWHHRGAVESIAVVLADFGSTTGDGVLDRALNDAVRIDLGQSPYLTVLPHSAMTTTMAAMRLREDEVVSPEVAREVCERNSAQVFIVGAVSTFGHRYLVSLRASSCLNGELLAEDKKEVDRQDDLPQAVDELAVRIRRGLGESRASIRRFDKPLFPAETGSLAALKAYSEGLRLGAEGKHIEALPFLRHAVELDPGFALAYFDIAAVYSTVNDAAHEAEFLERAYALRDTVSDVLRLNITAAYHATVTEDVVKGLETYKLLISLYPHNPMAFANMAELYDSSGQPMLGVEAAKQALALNPSNAFIYQTLASNQLHSGQAAEAKRTCESAFARQLDGVGIRDVLFQADEVLGDERGMGEQLAWGRTHKDAVVLLFDEAFVALSRGEARHAERLLDTLRKWEPPPEMVALHRASLSRTARMLAEEGLTAASVALLSAVPVSAQDPDFLIALAEDGQTSDVNAGLVALARLHASGTLWKSDLEPQIRAAQFLAEHRPQDAVSVLEAAQAFDGRTFGPAHLRGEAYMDLGKPDLALKEFRKIVDHEAESPLSNEYSLAVLGTARAYEQINDPIKAREQYALFLQLRKTADPDLPAMRLARRNFDQLALQLQARR